MTDVLPRASASALRKLSAEEQQARLKARYRADRRFKYYGLGAIGLALAMLLLLLGSIVIKGYSAFWQTEIRLPIEFSAELIVPDGKRDRDTLADGDYQALVRAALQAKFPEVSGRQELRALTGLVSQGGADKLRAMVLDDPSLIGARRDVWLPSSDDIDMLNKGSISAGSAQADRRVKDNELAWINTLAAEGRVESKFNTRFFTAGDSREPELAGVWGAIVGSFLTLVITMLLAFPIGVAAAIYLEEFAPKNRWTDLIEVNINNLAAVPSIVFGLLGLAMFLGTFGLPRSTPVVGGLTLALMTLPIIIIASRAALKAVPPSIREAARGLGASPMQVVFHHVLPLAMPGVLTGSILGMAHALGETAPLLMIGMVAFIVDIPGGPLDSATVLPVQIFIWADSPERAFVEKTSAAIIVLLGFLIVMNLAAVWLRRRFERRW
jgi:phosphate transport system permease protein